MRGLFRKGSRTDKNGTGAPAETAPPEESTSLPPPVIPEGEAPSVVIIGAGRMGQLIAGQLAIRGAKSVVLHDRSDFTRDRALAAVRASLQELEGDELLPAGMVADALDRIGVSDTLDATRTADIVVEAVPEDPELKKQIFANIDKVLTTGAAIRGEGPLLCSNSISIAPAEIFNKLKHKRWCNMRFLSPVYFVDEVELIADEANKEVANTLLRALGMTSIPKMEGDKLLSRQRVGLYYDRQCEAVKKAPKLAARSLPPTKKDLPECSVCLTETSGALILPCGHNSTCHECALQLCTLRHRGEHRCPICRGYIEKVLQADCPVKAESMRPGSKAGWAPPAGWNFLSR
mmetsp:Transcript_8048/g.22177  ORF Transcript_8048/g.22177 Transcript_8048/m.22177 type:complete len:347 (+) Transcript_8048:74-1114(+)